MAEENEDLPKIHSRTYAGNNSSPTRTSSQLVLGLNNVVAESAVGVLITGNDNVVGGDVQNVSIQNSSGCIVAGGLVNVSIFNSSGITVTESNTKVENGIVTYSPSVNYAIGDILYASNTLTLSRLAIGTAAQVLTVAAGLPSWAAIGAWLTTGNSGTIDGTHFIGNTDNKPFDIRVNNLRAGRIGISGENNAFFGYRAGVGTTGGNNSFFGNQAGESVVGGIQNTAFGSAALNSNNSNNNVALGYLAGYWETGASRLFIDNTSRANEATGRTEALIYGVFDALVVNQTLRFNASVGINTAPAAALDVNGDVFLTGSDRSFAWNGTSNSIYLDNSNIQGFGVDRLIHFFGNGGLIFYDQDNVAQMIRAGKDEGGVGTAAVRLAPSLMVAAAYGGSASGGSLSLRSTTHATKGKVIFGVNASVWDETTNRFGIGMSTVPTARLQLPAGSATANTAPLKFTSGTLLTTAEAGAIEFLTDKYYATITTGAARRQIAQILTATATLDFGSTAAQTSTDLTIAVTGAAVGDPVMVGLPAAPDANSCFTAWVSAADVVTVRFNNYSSGAIDPASASYKVSVNKQ